MNCTEYALENVCIDCAMSLHNTINCECCPVSRLKGKLNGEVVEGTGE